MKLLSGITLGFYNGLAKDNRIWNLGNKENVLDLIHKSPLYDETSDKLFIHEWTCDLKDKTIFEAIGYLTNFEVIENNKKSTEIKADCVLLYNHNFINPQFILKAFVSDDKEILNVKHINTWEIREYHAP